MLMVTLRQPTRHRVMQQRKVDWAASDESSETAFKEVNRIRSDKSARVNRSQKVLDNRPLFHWAPCGVMEEWPTILKLSPVAWNRNAECATS
jgi:hypothetical protein